MLIVLAVLGLLAVLVARADATPRRDAPPPGLDVDPSATEDDRNDDDDAEGGEARTSGRGRDLAEPWSAAGPCDCDEITFARLVARAPSVREVVDAAQRAAGLAEDGSRGWLRRARLSALVPFLSVRVGNTQSWREVVDPTVNRAVAFDVRAGWRLERLVFDSIELRISAQEQARRRERRTVAALATRAYFAWLRAEASAQRHPRWQVRAAEAAAEVDALTDAWFSQTLAKQLESR